MAKKDDLDLDVENKGKKKPSKLKLIIIILVAVLLLAGIGGGAAWYFLGANNPFVAQVDAEQTDQEGEEDPAKKKKKKKKSSNEPPLFTGLDPAFVVSFKDQSQARFMQLSVELMSRDAEVIKIVDEYKPMLRNNLLLLFSSQKYEDVATREGKEKLLAQTLEEVNDTLYREAGIDGVEAVYFTAFVAQ
ncbi:flagellar basal body-associated FliL family protein [Thiolapillus sp.]